ncbi:MAG: toll/interleukin-1 receptor domain-containing protein [Fibrobacteraceae bacterium]|nr:toll/interleukin-1 receptor domain-containing protein [Fibrobacteraceae bacterium]
MKKIVFISHITEEKDLALFVKDFIGKAFLGLIEVFVSSDEHSITLGQKWLNNITDSLKNCSVEIVLCSPKSIIRPWINFEAGAGWIRDIPVIPLCHSGMEPSKLPLPLNLLQAAKANEISSMKLLLPVLAQAIGSNIPQYDFSDFIISVNDFEKKYTFWSECNKSFGEIDKFNKKIIPALKTGKDIQIQLTEVDIRFFESIIPFLKANNILDFDRIGGVIMTPSGTFYGCNITRMSGIDTVFKDANFIY